MGFYVLLPLLLIVFVRRPTYRVPMLGSLVLLGIVSRHGVLVGWPRTPLAYVDNFALGMLAAVFVARARALPELALLGGLVAFVAGVTWPGVRPSSALGIAAVGLMFAIALCILASLDPPVPSVFVWLGTVSYGIYLWHWPILELTSRHGLYRLPDPIEILVVAALAILAGWLSWRLIESRVLRFRGGARAPGQSSLASSQRRQDRPTIAEPSSH
jgi:peptidoglycan/LPS O-acetylase OafA/YrhL